MLNIVSHKTYCTVINTVNILVIGQPSRDPTNPDFVPTVFSHRAFSWKHSARKSYTSKKENIAKNESALEPGRTIMCHDWNIHPNTSVICLRDGRTNWNLTASHDRSDCDKPVPEECVRQDCWNLCRVETRVGTVTAQVWRTRQRHWNVKDLVTKTGRRKQISEGWCWEEDT